MEINNRNPTFEYLDSLGLPDYNKIIDGTECWCKITQTAYVRLIKFSNEKTIFHNIEGPAVVRQDGTIAYWINDRMLSQAQFYQRTSKLGRALYGEGDKRGT